MSHGGNTRDLRHPGKSAELRCAAILLEEGWDVYLPLVDSGYDLVVSKGKRLLRVQSKSHSTSTRFEIDEPWRDRSFPDLVYLEAGDDWWLVPWTAYRRVAGKPKSYLWRGERWWHYTVTQPRAQSAFQKFFKEGGVRELRL